MKENILITIAARGGSKGVKDKNIKPLMGKPLIAYSILQALKWGKGEDIVCSTDSKRIAKTASKYGAKVPFKRPRSLAGGSISKVKVLSHALRECEKRFNKRYDIIVDLDATAPIRKIKDLDNCLKLFKKHRPKTLFSVVECHKNPYFNMVEEKKSKKVKLCKKTKKPIYARQDTPLVYDLNASIYFYRRDYLLSNKKDVVTDDTIAYKMDKLSAIDIDSKLDFKFIEFLMKERVWKSEV